MTIQQPFCHAQDPKNRQDQAPFLAALSSSRSVVIGPLVGRSVGWLVGRSVRP